jgi:hypothetical protein
VGGRGAGSGLAVWFRAWLHATVRTRHRQRFGAARHRPAASQRPVCCPPTHAHTRRHTRTAPRLVDEPEVVRHAPPSPRRKRKPLPTKEPKARAAAGRDRAPAAGAGSHALRPPKDRNPRELRKATARLVYEPEVVRHGPRAARRALRAPPPMMVSAENPESARRRRPGPSPTPPQPYEKQATAHACKALRGAPGR